MAKKEKDSKKTINVKLEWIAIGILSLVIVLSFLTSGFTNLPFNLKSPIDGSILGSKSLSEEEIKERVIKYVDEEVLQGQAESDITEISIDEESGLYKIKLVISGQEYDSYVSKDGKYLYTERLEIILEDEVAEYPQQDTPDVYLFTMSYCPYGNQAEDFVNPVYDLLKDYINFEPHYVIYSEDYGYSGSEYCLDDENLYCSMHGIGELNQGVRELCTYKYQKDKFWEFVLAANEECDYENIDECWEQIASNVGIDTEQIKTCQKDEAVELLSLDVDLNTQFGVTGSPAIVINGKDYTGDRTAEDFKNAVCAAFTNAPSECSQTLDDSGNSSDATCN